MSETNPTEPKAEYDATARGRSIIDRMNEINDRQFGAPAAKGERAHPSQSEIDALNAQWEELYKELTDFCTEIFRTLGGKEALSAVNRLLWNVRYHLSGMTSEEGRTKILEAVLVAVTEKSEIL
jgi:hypothetical protein